MYAYRSLLLLQMPENVISVGDRRIADLFVLVFEASRSGEVMISVPSAFQVRSLQRLVKIPNRTSKTNGLF